MVFHTSLDGYIRINIVLGGSIEQLQHVTCDSLGILCQRADIDFHPFDY